MLTFNEYVKYICEAGIRQGLPHITTMDHDQFQNLIKTDKVHINHVTEKTDGQSFKFGHDDQGFYTQSTGTGDEKMRGPEGYEARARARAEKTGKPLDLSASNAFGHIHNLLASNKKLQSHLKKEYKAKGEVTVRGETFYKPWGRVSEVPGEIKFVGTSYDPTHMGKVGKIVIHSQLPENKGHDLELFKNQLSDENINFDDDVVEHTPAHIDVQKEHNEFKKLDHGLLTARTTKTNKEAKLAEVARLDAIKQKVSAKVDKHVKSMGVSPKWGSGTEGLVIHPSEENPDAPRFKVTSDSFRAYRASGDKSWKQR